MPKKGAHKWKGWRAKTRHILRRRDGDLCCWCHEPMLFDPAHHEHLDFATLEHVIPKKEGGHRFDYSNLALSHRRCNWKRDQQPPPNYADAPRLRKARARLAQITLTTRKET